MIWGTFLTWGTEETNLMVGHMKNLITDLTPLMTIIVGIAVGLIIFWAIITAIKK